MTHSQKVEYHLEDLARRGVRRSSIVPPFFRLAWSLGFQILPPHFWRFSSLAILVGGAFALGFGGFTWGSLLLLYGFPVPASLALFYGWAPLAGGAVCGLTVAACYRWRARKLNLPPWDQYPLPEGAYRGN
jgi:hypothetical protein